MKNILLLLAFCACLWAQQAPKLDADTVAIVNGVKITKTELDRGVKTLFPTRYYHGTLSKEKMQEFEKEVLDELIENELLFQYAKTAGIDVPQSEVDESIEKLKELLETPERFAGTLQKGQWTLDEFKHALYKEAVLKKLYETKIKVEPTEQELKAYYDANLFKFKEPERIRVRVIYIKNDPTDPEGKSKAKARIDDIVTKLQEGEDFGELARLYSDAMSRVNNGDMGYIHKGMLDSAIHDVAFSLPTGKTSDVVEGGTGFYLVKVEEKSEPKQLSFDVIKEKLKKERTESIEKQRREAILSAMRKNGTIIR